MSSSSEWESVPGYANAMRRPIDPKIQAQMPELLSDEELRSRLIRGMKEQRLMLIAALLSIPPAVVIAKLIWNYLETRFGK